MTELEYTIRAICKRRGVTPSKIESVAFAFNLNSATADFAMLAAVANTFYYVYSMWFTTAPTTPTGSGNITFVISGTTTTLRLPSGSSAFTQPMLNNCECDSMNWNLGTLSAGGYFTGGNVFKITYA